MLGSKFLDLVLGVDIHVQCVPAPPAPLPSPFIGMIFDPVTAAAMVLGPCPLVTAIAVAMDPIGFVVNMAIDKLEGVSGDQVLINGLVASTTMTQPANRWICPHIPFPPAILFFNSGNSAPVLMGDAVYNLGSSSVWINSRRAVRAFIDPAFTCSEPLRLPTGVTIPIPLGAPVIIGGFPCPDIQAMISRAARAAITGAIKAAVNKPLTAALRRLPPGRLRSTLARAKCHVTGDPVDVATGRLLTYATDWELPGPIPLVFTREYSSAFSDRDGVLGYGWNHVLDEEVWLERGRVVHRAGDGREIQFDTVHLRERKIGVGDEIFEPVNRLWLRCVRDGFDVENADGRVHELRRVRGDRRPDRWRLVRIRSRDLHEIALDYDEFGRLAWVRDSEGRVLHFEHDRADRLIRISLPHPTVPGFVPHVSYEYSASGNLIAVRDALDNVSRYDYSGHLMVQRTDRTGLSFYFGYDGIDSTAYCVRTWGDGGIYDHELVYDKEGRRTFVTNSLGATTVYTMNEALLVEKITDAHGGTVEYAYDELLRTVKEVGPSGEMTEFEYDARGNCVRLVESDGGVQLTEFDDRNLCTRIVDAGGAVYLFHYDANGRLERMMDPLGFATNLYYSNGRVTAVQDSSGLTTRMIHDTTRRVSSVHLPNGSVVVRHFDALGRMTEERDERDNVRRFRYTALGDLDAVMNAVGLLSEYRYDGEGNIVEIREPNRHVRLTYGGFHKPVGREEAGFRVAFEYDSEDRLVAVVNEREERHVLVRDALGETQSETGFDGGTWAYLRDASGRVIKTISPAGRVTKTTYDAADRPIEVKHSDGTFAKFEYDARGDIVAAANENCEVRFERDVFGRVLCESQDGGATWVRSEYAPSGSRHLLQSDIGGRQRIGYTLNGSLESLGHGLSDDGGGVIRIQRDGFGVESARDLPGGVRVEWRRDAEGRPIERITVRRRSIPSGADGTRRGPSWHAVESFEQRPEPIDTRGYQWQGHDRISAVMNAATGPSFYERDARGRLVRETRPAEARVVERTMDAVGNVYRTADGSDRRFGRGGRIEAAAGAVFDHDADGYRIKKSQADGGEWQYRWNGHGMLSEVVRPDGRVVRFEYDAFARRTRKLVVASADDGAERVETQTRYVWDADTVIHELDGLMGPTTWYWEPGTLTPVMKEQAERRWSVASDHLGVPTELYDEAGELAWRMQLDVFGVPEARTGDARKCPWRWPGQYEDEETGLYYNRWRYYDPDIGAYVSSDPVGLEGGWRPFGYPVDPLRDFDPFGLLNPFEMASYGDQGHRGDGLDADELLGSIWLREHNHGGRRSRVGRQNPAIALDPALHRQINAAQRRAGLYDHATIRGQSAYQNIEANYRVRLAVLEAHFRSQGMSPARATRLARKYLDPLRREAQKFARAYCGA